MVMKGAPDTNEPTLSSAFRPTEDTKKIGPNDPIETMWIGAQLPAK
jgi:hypothetical protein